MKYTPFTFAVLLLLAIGSLKATTIPFPTNGMITLTIPNSASCEEQNLIQADFARCIDVSLPFLRILKRDEMKTNNVFLAGLWTPEKYPVVVFPCFASRTNDVFTIPLNETFLSEYRQHLMLLSPYTNEIAQMETFIQTLAATNRAMMTDNELLGGLMLSKEASPGTHNIPSFLISSQRAAASSGSYHMPPLASFFTMDIGPSGQSTYLWSLIPVVESGGVITQPAIYYNGRWWLSNWMLERGEQQW